MLSWGSSDDDSSEERSPSPPRPPSRPQPLFQPRSGDIRPRSLSSRLHPYHRSDSEGRTSTSRPAAPSQRPRQTSDSGRGALPDPQFMRQTIVAMDRKRRLTGSAYEHESRRHTPSDFRSRPREQDEPNDGSATGAALQQTASNEATSTHNIVDLTDSSPPPHVSPPMFNAASRTSSSSSRRYVVPRWQPDTEVTECPICKRTFTFMFRRHHCRKCGRVVCNDCSPHRITIPRQFIVNPPGPDRPPSPARESAGHTETINLTGDDDVTSHSRRDRRSSNQLVEGGEKVRLCNPCVPDPQPDPLPNFPPPQPERPLQPRPDDRLLRTQFPPYPSEWSPSGHQMRHGGHRAPPFHRGGGDMAPPTFGAGTILTTRPRPNSLVTPYPSQFPFSASPNNGPPRPYENPLPPLPHGFRHQPGVGHTRYSSMDTQARPTRPEYPARTRISSLTDAASRSHGLPSSLPTPTAEPRVRRRINEEDICPVCRRALPDRGADGDETTREAHIMDCISARDPQNQGEPGSSSRGALHMITFQASEKDCVGGDGNTQECSICMEEYDVGDELARLECWCKFHKQCIVSWLNRKAECPVHKASAMHYL